MKFRLSDDLMLGAGLVVSTAGIFATKGLGKTHLAQVMAEEMLAHGQVIVAIDPTDAWWGLRSSADGRSEGYPVVVIGGDHGQLKLEPGGAVELAEAVVTERFSCVICTDGMSDMAETKFVREFLDTIYRRNREPIHIFVDEADMFAPSKPFDVEDARCIRAMSHVVRRGRKKGIGTTLITQRPAELSASVRTMVDMLFVLGMSHNLDIDAVEKWMRLRKKKHGDNAAFALQEEMIASLDSLQQGDAWIWAPRLKIHKRFRARDKHTFDSGATPNPGQRVKVPKKLAAVDLARLGQAMAAAVERQKENDPKELKKQIVELRKELTDRDRAEAPVKPPAPSKPLAAPIAKGDLDRLDKLIARTEGALVKHDTALSRHHDALEATLESSAKTLKALITSTAVAIDELRAKVTQVTTTVPRSLPMTLPIPAKVPSNSTLVTSTPSTPVTSPSSSKEDPTLKPAHLRLLTAIAWWENLGVSEPDLVAVAFAAETSTKSSAFDNNRSRLHAAGYIEYPAAGQVRLTAAGRTLAPSPSLPPTNTAFQEAVLARVTPACGRLLRVLINVYPREISLEDWATSAGTTTTSSAFDNNRSWLRARGLSHYPRTGFVAATPLLFPEDARP